MKISNNTLNILKWLSTINSGIKIDVGNKLYSKFEANSMCAMVEISLARFRPAFGPASYCDPETINHIHLKRRYRFQHNYSQVFVFVSFKIIFKICAIHHIFLT